MSRHREGDQRPCSHLDDYDCDGTLVVFECPVHGNDCPFPDGCCVKCGEEIDECSC